MMAHAFQIQDVSPHDPFKPTAKTYGVGEKSATQYFDSFEDALAYLRNMKVAKWWRPNQAGRWGLVSAARRIRRRQRLTTRLRASFQ